MEKIGKHENINEYAKEYFERNESLKSNFCAITDETLLKKMKEVPLSERLKWAVRSQHKDVHSDSFQFNLFSTFDKDELATILLTFNQDDKDRLVDSKFYSKMPSKTMQNLFLYNEAIKDIEDEDIRMLVNEYSINHPYTIYEFMKGNDKALSKRVFWTLFDKLPTEKQVYDIEQEYGVRMSMLDQLLAPREPRGRNK